jgi:hypothetical protein
MLSAYHMVGLPALAYGSLASGEVAQADTILKETYQRIRSNGFLRPASSLGNRESRQFFGDVLAGDDQYVFLSLGRRYWNDQYPTTNYGFIFDAERLLLDGAILRTHDLLSEYEELFDEAVSSIAPYRSPDEWSAQELANLKAATADLNMEYSGPNDAFYALQDAAKEQRFAYPGVREVLEQFRSQALQLQKRTQILGSSALDAALKEGETGNYEILVPDRLLLSKTSKFIIAGQTLGAI